MPTTDELLAQLAVIDFDPAAELMKRMKSKPPRAEIKEEDMPALPAKEGFTFGADPELFIFNQDGVPVPPDRIPGNKAEPYPVPGGAVQRDGFAAEFNINPASSFEEFNSNINSVLAALKDFLPDGYELRATSAVTFPEDVFDGASDEAKELGCQPDFNAWTGEINPPPCLPDDPRLRCTGGHLHIGWTNDAEMDDVQHIINCRDLVKQLDWWLGGWSLRHDTDPARRKLYGRAGACRIKPYGVEYRVLSSFWVLDEKRRLAVWNRMMQAIDSMSTHYLPDTARHDSDYLVNAINATSRNLGLEKVYRYPLTTVDASFRR